MSLEPLLYVSQDVADDLNDGVEEHIDRYFGDGFCDKTSEPGWSIPLHLTYDPAPLRELRSESGKEAEIHNTLKVWQSLRRMTPALACENRIWVRLSHCECFEYSRKRWLKEPPESGEQVESEAKAIRKHFFALNLNGWRDDHAISRLWWNARISNQIMPGSMEEVLNEILHTADRRFHLLERSWIFSRRPLAQGIIRLLKENAGYIDRDGNLNNFMKALNVLGAGAAFEAMNEHKIDTFLERCLEKSDDFRK